jgi:hypothetical protein
MNVCGWLLAIRAGNRRSYGMGINNTGWPHRLYIVDDKAGYGKRDQVQITFSLQKDYYVNV